MRKNKEYNSLLTDRIRERLGVVKKSAAEASKNAFKNDGTIRNILLGNSKHPRSDTMSKLADELETSPSYLLGETDDPTPPIASARTSPTKPLPKREDPSRPTPVYASAEGGDGALIVTSEPVDYAPRPNIITDEDDLYGVVIEGTSMMKAYRPGDTAWIHPRYKERRDEPCIFRGFNDITGEARATIKWLVDFNSERWVVEQFNPPKTLELKKKEWPDCYRVLGKKNRA